MKHAVITLALLAIVLGTALSCAKKTAEDKFNEAVQSYQQRDALNAVVLATEILQEQTTGPLAMKTRVLLYNIYLGNRDYKGARTMLDEIINARGLNSPEGQEAARRRIETYSREGRPRDALLQATSFLDAVTTGSDFWAELMLGRSGYFLQQNELTTAQKVIETVLATKGVSERSMFEALPQIDGAFATTDSAKTGVRILQTFLDTNATTRIQPNILMVMGHLSDVAKDKEQAEQYYQKAFKIYDERYERASGADAKIRVLIEYARARSFREDSEGAVKLLQKGIDEFRAEPNRIELYFVIAEIYAGSKQHDKAIEAGRTVQAEFTNDPNRPRAYFMIAQVLAQQKKFDEAEEELRNVMKLFPNTQYAQQAARLGQSIAYFRRADANTSAALALKSTTSSMTTTSTAPITPTTATAQAPQPAETTASSQTPAARETTSTQRQPK
jgi:tetratricopeptide (TPR) repeat protein